MQIGAMNFPFNPLVNEIELIGKMGFDYIEIAMDQPRAHWMNIRKDMKAILSTLEHYHLDVICHLPTFVFIADLTEAIRSASLLEVLHSLHTAKMLRAKKVVLHPGISSGLFQYAMKKMIRCGIESIESILNQARELDITVLIENMPPQYRCFFSPSAFRPLFDSFPELGMTFDIGHAHINDRNGKKIFNFLSRYSDRIRHVHMSDNMGKSDDHLPLGEGGIDFRSALKELKLSSYEDTITLEVFSKNRKALAQSRSELISWLSDG